MTRSSLIDRKGKTMVFGSIPNFGNYYISTDGVVKNIETGRILHQYEDKNGYMRVTLTKNRKQKRFGVHRLVAEAFIPNTEGKPQVNHIDGNKKNNSVDNLEWATGKQNQQHRRNILKSGLVKVKCVETGVVYESIKEASQKNKTYIPNIVRACKNGSTANNLHWEYVKQEKEKC